MLPAVWASTVLRAAGRAASSVGVLGSPSIPVSMLPSSRVLSRFKRMKSHANTANWRFHSFPWMSCFTSYSGEGGGEHLALFLLHPRVL